MNSKLNFGSALKLIVGLLGFCIYSVAIFNYSKDHSVTEDAAMSRQDRVRTKRGAEVESSELKSPIVCPAGFTGQYCETALCLHKGYVRGGAVGLVEIESAESSVCTEGKPFAVDSFLSYLSVSLSTPLPSPHPPSIVLTDPNGVTIGSAGLQVVQNTTNQLLLGITAPKPGRWVAQLYSSSTRPCTLGISAYSAATMTLGFTTDLHSDIVSTTMMKGTPSYAVFEALSFVCGGKLTTAEVWLGGSLLMSGPIKTRYNCAYGSYFGLLTCSQATNYTMKVFGIDPDGFLFEREFQYLCSTSPAASSIPET